MAIKGSASLTINGRAEQPSPQQAGFTLTEVLVVVAIVALLSVVLAGNLRQKIDQGRVDAVTTRLEAALNGLRRQSLSYQTSCQVTWASALIANQAVSASADQIGTKLQIDASQCPYPTGVPLPRFSPPLRSSDNTVLVTITPVPFTITSIGGLSTATNQPLIFTIQPNRASQDGDFVRCLYLAVDTGAITRGTWVQNGGQYDCKRNR